MTHAQKDWLWCMGISAFWLIVVSGGWGYFLLVAFSARGELFTPLQPDPVTLSAALVSLVPVAVCVILICAIASYESAKPWHYVFWFGMVALGYGSAWAAMLILTR